MRKKATGTGSVTSRKVKSEPRSPAPPAANQEEALKLVAEAAPTVLFTCRWDGYVEYVNKAFYDYTGMPEGEALGFGWLAAIQPDDLQKIRESMLRATKSAAPPEAIEHRVKMADGSYRWFVGRARAVRGENGRISRWVGSCADIEDLKRAQHALHESEESLRKQQEAVRALSTPVLEVSPRLLIVPIIGTVDPQRARQLTEQLLQGIRDRRAKAVVVDVTGVPQMDEAVANHLLQTGEAARLLGAEFIVSGISRQIAESLVNLGVDLSRLVTVGDLRNGIERANEIAGAGDSQQAA